VPRSAGVGLDYGPVTRGPVAFGSRQAASSVALARTVLTQRGDPVGRTDVRRAVDDRRQAAGVSGSAAMTEPPTVQWARPPELRCFPGPVRSRAGTVIPGNGRAVKPASVVARGWSPGVLNGIVW
jgi:hypothetical protein